MFERDLPVRVARHPRRGRRPRRGADLRHTTNAASRCTACARPEITRLYLQVPRRTTDRRRLAGRARLGRAAAPASRPTGSPLNEGPVLEKGVTADAQLRRRAHAARPAVPGRRRRAHRAADRRQGHEPRDRRRRACSRRAARGACARRTSATCSTRYSATCLRRVWRAEHFSWWMTSMLHVCPGDDRSSGGCSCPSWRTRRASRAAATSLAENYVGLPHPEFEHAEFGVTQ